MLLGLIYCVYCQRKQAIPTGIMPNTEVKRICADNTWRAPVAVPGSFLAGEAAASSADRGHSLTSFGLPPAALGSLPREDR